MSAWLTSVVGIPTPSDSLDASDVHAVAVWAQSHDLTPSAAVAAWALAQAGAAGGSLRNCGLRLFVEDLTVGCPITAGSPSDLGHLYETMLSGDVRKRGGVHLTPADIAARLIGLLDDAWLRPGVRVLDPSVGGGAFLIAAADALVAAGVSPDQAIAGLCGVDHDPTAVAVAETALALWRISYGLEPIPTESLRVGDGLLDTLPPCDVAVGNPPFLTQLRTASANAGSRREALRERWGDLVTAYTDEAWLFLAAALKVVAPGGQLVMVQPVSVLAARHGRAVRDQLTHDGRLVGLWVGDGRIFDASVEVCAPLLRRRTAGSEPTNSAAVEPQVRRWRSRAFDELDPGPTAPGGQDWGRLGAGITGIPDVRLRRPSADAVHDGATLGDVATVTAGFRDQFYGLAPYVTDADVEALTSQRGAEHLRRLATVGMLDPFRFRWGSAEFRFAGDRYRTPVVDVDQLRRDDPELGRWVDARHRPKLLIATQTKVVEAWVDEAGTVVPATPTISLEPHDADDADQLWRMLAVLMSPAVSADVAAACFGTALSIRALKVSARDVASLPLPHDQAAWEHGAELARTIQTAVHAGGASDDVLAAFGDVMQRAFGVRSAPLVGWWRSGWPKR